MAIYVLVWAITTSGFVGEKTVNINVQAFKTVASCMTELEKLQKSDEGKGSCMKVEIE